MTKRKEHQALALSSRHPQLSLPGIPGGSFAALELEATKIFEAGAARRAEASASGHIVIAHGRVSGYVTDDHVTVQFGGGSLAVTTNA